jgi:hypothetical protein
MSSNLQNSGTSGPKLIYNIETRECGVWETIETADSELEAFRIASNLTLTTREEWVRVVDPNCKIL